MIDHFVAIAQFIYEAFVHIWPYLLVTIPIAVAVQLSGAAKHINRAFTARPVVAILLATVVGAFSPFCSCGVIPVIAALLIGGVPLAPVMAFWIASPSMDPEIFFLSVGTLGWQLAIWRLASTLVLSLSAGFITHFIFQKGWLGEKILRDNYSTEARSRRAILESGWQKLKQRLTVPPLFGVGATVTEAAATNSRLALSAQTAGVSAEADWPVRHEAAPTCDSVDGTSSCNVNSRAEGSCGGVEGSACEIKPVPFRRRLLDETLKATIMVVQFMALAFFLEALITLYVPSEWIVALLGNQNRWAIIAAAILGVPVYTSNLAALPLIGGLLAQGMDPAAALAFLIAGPTTTLPAMAAVWGLASRRVFALYVSLSLVGAVVLGTIYGGYLQLR